MSDEHPLTIEQCKNIEFWRSTCPILSISDQPLDECSDRDKRNELRNVEWETCKKVLSEDGYFAYESWFNKELIDRLAACFDNLAEKSIHPVFAFVYDEFWHLLIELEPFFSDLLGDYWSLPAVWSWFVDHENQSGFTPHRDQVREVGIEDEDHLDYLTIWIPLTDLNHLSSSICVLPASLDPDYEDGTPEIRVENLQDVRSLQGKRGSIFCWTTQLAHWGTKQSEYGQPRKSVGFYVQKSDAECIDGPPMEFSKPLSLNQRLAIIGQQIFDYSRTAGETELKFANELVQLSCTECNEAG